MGVPDCAGRGGHCIQPNGKGSIRTIPMVRCPKICIMSRDVEDFASGRLGNAAWITTMIDLTVMEMKKPSMGHLLCR